MNTFRMIMLSTSISISSGVYYQFKEMQTTIYHPGMNYNFHPFGGFEYVDIRPQVDYIKNVDVVPRMV